MNTVLKRLALFVVLGGVSVYGYLTLRGPQGIPGVSEKWKLIRMQEEDNARLQRENEYRRERIRKLEKNTSEQGLEIRKQLKLLRPGETSFILPGQPKQDAAKKDSATDANLPDAPAPTK